MYKEPMPPAKNGPAPYTSALENILKDTGMKAASRTTFVNFLSHMPEILSNAYTVKVIQNG